MNTLEYLLEKYPDKPWNWNDISRNPNITIKFIETYHNKINFNILAANTFIFENKRIKKKEYYWLLEKIQAFNKTENLVIFNIGVVQRLLQ